MITLTDQNFSFLKGTRMTQDPIDRQRTLELPSSDDDESVSAGGNTAGGNTAGGNTAEGNTAEGSTAEGRSASVAANRLAEQLSAGSAVNAVATAEPSAANDSRISRAKNRVCAIAGLLSDNESLSGEIQEVLRKRLRIVAILLFAGYISFLLLSLIFDKYGQENGKPILLVAHATMVIVTGLVASRLCMRCRHFERHLRMVEFMLFGGSAVMFIAFTIVHLNTAIADSFPPVVAPPWMLLIFIYALLVPNTWQRAFVVSAVFATIPIGLLIYTHLANPAFADVAQIEDAAVALIAKHFLMLTLTTATAVFGVASTRSLRTQAHEARRLGQYRLKQLLGEGGMGAVYVAEHVMLKRPCAVKLIRPAQAGDPRAMARFEREVRSTAQLAHWNIVEIYDYGETDEGVFYYVMEYLPGLSLSELVDLGGPLEPARSIHLLRQTAAALAEAHAAGMIHRDIKPANIYAAQRGRRHDVAKLLDFGLVSTADTVTEDAALTREGTITGSPSFLSPEQAMGEKPDERSDIYSLGTVGYFLLTGHAPFERDTMMKTILAHAHDAPVPPSQVVDVATDIEQVILKCLAKKPGDRYQSAEELQRDLENCAIAHPWDWRLSTAWWNEHTSHDKQQLDDQVVGQG
jgi:serine/threonine-protein kinase